MASIDVHSGLGDWPAVDDWGWTLGFVAPELRHVGAVSLELLTRGHEWVNRRVETIELIDEDRVRLQISVDFRLPQRLPGAVRFGDRSTYFIPIAFLPRRNDLSYFDAVDESGASVPLLTRDDNGQLTGLVLVAAAERAVGRARAKLEGAEQQEFKLSDALKTYLQSLPMRPALSFDILRAVTDRSDFQLYPDPRVAKALLEDLAFRRLVAIGAESSAVHVPVDATSLGQRRIVKLSWEQRWSGRSVDGHGRSRLARSTSALVTFIGWRAYSPWLPRPQIGGAKSHHIQISVPANVEMTEAGLICVDPSDLLSAMVGDGDATESAQTRRMVTSEPGFMRTSHLYVERAHAPMSGTVWVRLRASRAGFLPGAVLTALLVALVLTLCWRNAHDVGPAREAAAAVLLLVPALMAGWLVQPREHAMARRLLRVPRALTTIVAALPLMAATVLVAVADKSPPGWVQFIVGDRRHADWKLTTSWFAFAVIAFVCAFLLALSWRLPRPPRRPGNSPPAHPQPPAAQ
jgi:hypothetical protein